MEGGGGWQGGIKVTELITEVRGSSDDAEVAGCCTDDIMETAPINADVPSAEMALSSAHGEQKGKVGIGTEKEGKM